MEGDGAKKYEDQSMWRRRSGCGMTYTETRVAKRSSGGAAMDFYNNWTA
jgi:hypothetical protein